MHRFVYRVMRIYHKGFNFSQDGPGNRLVYHVQGCNLRCQWCSNPESMPANAESAKDYTTDEIVAEALSCRPMFFSGGGVTFTGGEPTVQFDALAEALASLESAGINTCIENNGTHERLCELSELIDFMIVDFKHPDPEKHRYYTGADNAVIIDNIRKLSRMRRQTHIRIPLVRGVNDCADDFIHVFRTFDLSSVTAEVLKYHEYGRGKWTGDYKIKNGFVTEEEYLDFVNALRSAGVRIVNY